MNKFSITSFFCSIGSVSLIGLFLLSGCATETRYDDSTRKYSVGQYDDATAYYNSRPGNSSVPHSESIKMRPAPQGTAASGSGQQSDGMSLTLDVTDVLFEFDKAVIKTEFVPELDSWADYFQKNTEETAVIYGHTDNIGTVWYNQTLSEKRAQAVVDYLVKRGVDSSRLTAKGVGEGEPVMANDSKDGRQKNRRVELKK